MPAKMFLERALAPVSCYLRLVYAKTLALQARNDLLLAATAIAIVVVVVVVVVIVKAELYCYAKMYMGKRQAGEETKLLRWAVHRFPRRLHSSSSLLAQRRCSAVPRPPGPPETDRSKLAGNRDAYCGRSIII